jgi:HEAT repeat protein
MADSLPVSNVMRPLRFLIVLAVAAAAAAISAENQARPAEDATGADEALLREAKITPDGPGLLAFFRKRSLTDEDRQRLEDLVRQLGSPRYKVRVQAFADLLTAGPPALPFLRAAVNDPDLEISKRAKECIEKLETGPLAGAALPAAAARLLAVRRPAGAVAALLTYYPFIDPREDYLQEEVLLALGSLGVVQGKVDPLLTRAAEDKFAPRRAAAAFVLGRMAGPDQRAVVRRLLGDGDAQVRQRAARGLVGQAFFQEANQSATVDEALLRDHKIGTDAAGLIDFLRKRSLSEEDRRRIELLVRQLGHPSFKKRKEAHEALVQLGTPALPFLRPGLHDGDLEVVRRVEQIVEKIESGPGTALPLAAIRLLAKRRPPEAVKVLLTYAPSADDDNVEDAVIAALSALSVTEEKLDPALTAALTDAAAARRGAAAYVLARVGNRDDCRSAARLLEDSEPVVRLRAAQGLLFAKDRRALHALLALLKDGKSYLTSRVEEVLRPLAGIHAPAGSINEGTAEERAKTRAAWLAWGQNQADRVDLARLGQQPAELGLTVICEFDGTRGGGHAWEFGRDFKPRWKLENLQGPMDVHVLGEDKLLIAEYYARRVSERTKKGDIQWEYQVPNYPIACSRLSNGNTFIATYTNLMEVTREKKVVHDYNRAADGQIYSAQKLPTGHMVYMTSMGWVVTLDKAGTVLHRFNVGNPGAWCGVEWLPGGRLLVTQMASGKIMEVDAATGKRVYWQATVEGAHQTLRMSNGNTMVVCMNNKRLVEVNRAGKIVWEKPMEGRPWRVHRR